MKLTHNLFKNLRMIFCKHDFEKQPSIVLREAPYYEYRATPLKCIKCGHTKLGQKWHVHKSSSEASALIKQCFTEKGTYDDYKNYKYGSWFYCEFPQSIAEIIDSKGEDAARQYIMSL